MRMRTTGAVILVLLLASSGTWAAHNPSAVGVVDGISGTNFQLAARDGYVASPADGNSIYVWSYADLSGGSPTFQYPGPTLILNQWDLITIEFTNELAVNSSMVFPGQAGVVASPDPLNPTSSEPGLLTLEAKPGGKVIYTFTALHAGTFQYHSGTRTDLQTEMGMIGGLIVRPSGFNMATKRWAYDHESSAYSYEVLILMTDMDLTIHTLVESGGYLLADTRAREPVQWFMNGRPGPDTLFGAFASWLPTQP
jgi:FtsP/CotA-like multicopper oxidase with cupredoxin domain